MHSYVATVGELDLIIFDSDCSLFFFFFFFFSLGTLQRCYCRLLYVYIL